MVSTEATKTVCGVFFSGYGAHCDAYPHTYINAASAIGMEHRDVEGFAVRCAYRAVVSAREKERGGHVNLLRLKLLYSQERFAACFAKMQQRLSKAAKEAESTAATTVTTTTTDGDTT